MFLIHCILPKKQQTRKNSILKNSLTVLGAGAVAAGAVVANKKGLIKKAGKFIQSEGKQLAKEINETKLAKFVDKKVNSFTSKNPKVFCAMDVLSAIGILGASSLAQLKLSESLSNDIKKKATQNYYKGKAIQELARKHFDSIDAKEV